MEFPPQNWPINLLFQFFLDCLAKLWRFLTQIYANFSSTKNNKKSKPSPLPCPAFPPILPSDVLLDIADFLNLEQRQQLLLVNRQFCRDVESGMRRLWCTEQRCMDAGDLVFGKSNLLVYRANFIKLMGRQNLFLRIRVRLVEDVNVGHLGHGDALIVAVEYRPLNGTDNKKAVFAELYPWYKWEFESIFEYVESWRQRMCKFWESPEYDETRNKFKYANDTGGWTIEKKKKPTTFWWWPCIWCRRRAENADMRQFERRLFISSGKLLWGETHRIQLLGHTLAFVCRLRAEDQRWARECLIDNKYGSTHVTLQDCLTYEILRTPYLCWPRERENDGGRASYRPFDGNLLKMYFGIGTDKEEDEEHFEFELYAKIFYARPKSHVGIDVAVHFDYQDKPAVYANELELHYAARLVSSNFQCQIREFWHRSFHYSAELIEKNPFTWQCGKDYFYSKSNLLKQEIGDEVKDK